MTRLRIYNGPEVPLRLARFTAPLPDVIPFAPRSTNRFPRTGPLARAKALHENRRCHSCGHADVDPVTLNDGIRDGSGQYVPGSATLVGFHCNRCHEEW